MSHKYIPHFYVAIVTYPRHALTPHIGLANLWQLKGNQRCLSWVLVWSCIFQWDGFSSKYLVGHKLIFLANFIRFITVNES